MLGHNILIPIATIFSMIGLGIFTLNHLVKANREKIREQREARAQLRDAVRAAFDNSDAPVECHMIGKEACMEVSMRWKSGSLGYFRITRPDQKRKKQITVYIAVQRGEERVEQTYSYGGKDDYEAARALADRTTIRGSIELEHLLMVCDRYGRLSIVL